MPVRRLLLAATLFAAATTVAAARQPADDPLTADERAALQKKLGELSGMNDAAKRLLADPDFMNRLQNDPAFRERLGRAAGGANPFGQNPIPPQFPRIQPPAAPPAAPPRPRGEGFEPPQRFPLDPERALQDRQAFERFMQQNKMRPRGIEFDPRVQNNPGLQNLLGAWERNVGPLDNTPELKKAMIDFFEATGTDGFGEFGGNDFLSKLELEGGQVELNDWLKNVEMQNWNLPNVGLKDWFAPKNPNAGNWNANLGGGWKLPSTGPTGVSSGGGFSLPGIDSPWLPLVLIAVAAAGYFAWKYWPQPTPKQTAAEALAGGTDAWPVDPRTIANREQLVAAFEFLSVLLCGDKARVWNHHTIAAALRAQVPGSDPVADELAHLYEVARYSPPGDPLTEADLAAARRCLCALAGVPAA